MAKDIYDSWEGISEKIDKEKKSKRSSDKTGAHQTARGISRLFDALGLKGLDQLINPILDESKRIREGRKKLRDLCNEDL